ncbi:hypothetical protein [Microbulbifer sp. ARAS458-1]|uniref:hypothetical protein n=1 Tax=Microbulbifer sp. ARAS458-1 TaxID=3140242 RepID=UPI0038781E5D
MRRILIVSSPGGHSVQARVVERGLAESLPDAEFLHFLCDGSERIIKGESCNIRDFNINSIFLGGAAFRGSLKLLRAYRPDVVISTGAAPGLIVCVAAKLLNCSTIWVDSIANVERVSLSGRVAACFVDQALVQWPKLANRKFQFLGSVI